MQSLSFTPGRAFLSSNSPTVPWTVVFEDEGLSAYFYACDRSQETQEKSILDAMMIYNVAALARSDLDFERPEPQRIAAVEWSRDGLQIFFTRGVPGKVPLSTWSVFWDSTNPHRFNSGSFFVIGK